MSQRYVCLVTALHLVVCSLRLVPDQFVDRSPVTLQNKIHSEFIEPSLPGYFVAIKSDTERNPAWRNQKESYSSAFQEWIQTLFITDPLIRQRSPHRSFIADSSSRIIAFLHRSSAPSEVTDDHVAA